MGYLDTKHKRKSFTLTTVLMSLLLLLLFFVGLAYLDPPPENGISVNFGTTAYGSGKVQPKEPIQSSPQKQPSPATPPQVSDSEPETEELVSEPEASAEDVATAELEETIRINKAKEVQKKAEAEAKRKAVEAERKKKAEEARKEKAKKDAEERKRKEQEAKKRSLDNLIGGIGKSDGKTSGGEGNDNKAGDKGDPLGNPYASSYFGSPGSGRGGKGYGLNGRNLKSSTGIKQDCNEEGRVVVKIEVDRNGTVVKATPGVRGTTNSHPCLMKPAKETAMRHRWNADNKAPARQIGFVVVNFKLGE